MLQNTTNFLSNDEEYNVIFNKLIISKRVQFLQQLQTVERAPMNRLNAIIAQQEEAKSDKSMKRVSRQLLKSVVRQREPLNRRHVVPQGQIDPVKRVRR